MTVPPLKGLAALLAFTLIASACKSLDQQALDDAADSAAAHAERAEYNLHTGQLPAAIREWRAAVSALRPGSSDYLLGKLYLAHSKFESGIGWAHLLAGEPEAAGRAYRTSIQSLRDGVRAHQAILRDNNESAELFVNLAQMAAYGAASYATARHASYTAAPSYFQPTYVPMPEWVELPEPQVRLPGAKVLHGGLQGHVVRIPVVPDRGPLKRVGRVRIGDSGWCTGSLVGPRIVLTNAHCVVRNEDPDDPRSPGELSFHLEKVRYTMKFPVRTYFTHRGERQGYDSARNRGNQGAYPNDWAVLVIDLPPGQKLGYLTIDPGLSVDSHWPAGDKLVLAGYSSDLNDGQFMTMHWGCQPRTIRAVLEYDCSTWKGSSGSPVFRVSNGRWRVVGVHACGRREPVGSSFHACGPHIKRVVSTIARLRRDYPYL